jgi:hypothetical protein
VQLLLLNKQLLALLLSEGEDESTRARAERKATKS